MNPQTLYRHIDGHLYTAEDQGNEFLVCRQGGGFLHRIPAEVFRREFEPAGPLPKPRKGLVTGFFIGGDPLPAYFDEQLWNGWAEPYFERDVLLGRLKTERGLSNVTYDAKADEFIAFMGGDEAKMTAEEREEMTERYPAQQVETTDGVKTLYGLGAGSWCWEVYSGDQTPEMR